MNPLQSAPSIFLITQDGKNNNQKRRTIENSFECQFDAGIVFSIGEFGGYTDNR
jgi:hypothetical protein